MVNIKITSPFNESPSPSLTFHSTLEFIGPHLSSNLILIMSLQEFNIIIHHSDPESQRD